MSGVLAYVQRDLRSLFCVPTGAIVASLFVCLSGVAFVSGVFDLGGIATMQPVFEFAAWLLLILCPAITMRLVAEERRLGTWELSLASPLSSLHLALGKFLAGWIFLLVVLLTSLPLVAVLEIYAQPDYGAVCSGYFGLMLLGGAVIASGIAVSALTTSQTVAYLVTTFIWLTVSLATKVLPAMVPARLADFIFAVDPDLRTGAFSMGLIDTSGIVYFLSIIVVMIVVAIFAIDLSRRPPTQLSKVCIASISLIATLIALNDLALNERFRIRVDATGSRAYTLSNQTTQFIDSLDAPWSIVVLLDEAAADRSVVRQIDEVLRLYSDTSENISVKRIDPTDPGGIRAFDGLLRDIMAIYADELLEAEVAIEQGTSTFRELMLFASSESAWAEIASQLQVDTKEQETLQTLATSLELLGREGTLILEEVEKAMFVDLANPLPRIAIARDILAAANGRWAAELSEVSWWLQEGRSEVLERAAKEESAAFESMATKLALSDDVLRRLGRLELGELAHQLTEGQGAVLISPDRATMVSASLLFPDGRNTQGVAQDQRFRGEQIISSAMRSLASPVVPTVVFVHAEQHSLLSRQKDAIDLSAVRGLLETSRIRVLEWNPVDSARPSVQEGPVVYVVIPPSSRAGLEISQRERSLLDVTGGLLAGGEAVMLNIQPSLLPRYGQEDPWTKLIEGISLHADTSRVLLQQVAVGPQQIHIQRGQLIDRTLGDHSIARAVDGRRIYVPLPIGIHGGETLFSITPREDRWLEEAWAQQEVDATDKKRLEQHLPIAAAVVYHDDARAIVVGSGGWLLSWAADRATRLGDGQVTMANPGNSELLLASVEWLAGLDDWIAASPIGQQTSRIEGLSQNMYVVWSFVLVLGLPAIFLGVSATVAVRRRAT